LQNERRLESCIRTSLALAPRQHYLLRKSGLLSCPVTFAAESAADAAALGHKSQNSLKQSPHRDKIRLHISGKYHWASRLAGSYCHVGSWYRFTGSHYYTNFDALGANSTNSRDKKAGPNELEVEVDNSRECTTRNDYSNRR